MSLAEIEAELERLSPEELRELAMKSWAVFWKKEGESPLSTECDENDPSLLAALDEALRRADSDQADRLSGDQVRARIGEWTSSK